MRLKSLANKILSNRRGLSTELPQAHIDWLTSPASRFFKIEAAAGMVLLFFTLLALYLANSPFSKFYFELWHVPVGLTVGSHGFERSLHGWISDAVMTLFFFVISLELKREAVLGELRNPRIAALSIIAATGGMLVPAGIYLYFQFGQPGQHGWGTVMATDTAFLIGCLALLGTRVPKSLRVFILSLAIVDDIGAIIVVALGYGSQIDWLAVGMALVGFLAVRIMAVLGIRSVPLFFIAGGLTWLAVDASGIHPTVTGVILGLMTPTNRWVSDDRLHAIMDCVVASPRGDDLPDRRVLSTAEAAAREARSPVERLEMLLHPWVGFVVMPLFAFANAGIPLTGSNFTAPVTMAVFFGFVVGKPLGILAFSWLAVQLRIATLPPDLRWRIIVAGGMLAGIGFTMAMFIANLAYSPGEINSAKLGILSASVFSALMGLILLWLFTGGKNAVRTHETNMNERANINS